ncbi:MAG TPA: DGQHR domain-containing protein DpdB [Allosphingosinicella sp.]|jgi:DGQHR domain-containing protein
MVVSFVAKASDLRRFAAIDRIGRDAGGALRGFQRPQIAGHIREIREYLEGEDAILPNPIVVAFTTGVLVEMDSAGGSACRLTIDVGRGPSGLVVDGQQRLSALFEVERDFEVFVSAVVCADESELRRQFVLINNTRPLPKSLIYELLPGVESLPKRLSNRSFAAELTARLNYDSRSSLRAMIHQHTNPAGVISDSAIQRVIMNSLSDGMMREFLERDDPGVAVERSVALISDFYAAAARVFPEAWLGHTPKTSRLVHGAGIVAMGYVMEVLALLDGARAPADFARGLGCLVGRTAWTGGEWDFGAGDVRHWKAIQNVNRDIVLLAQHLIGIVRADLRARRQAAAENVTPHRERARRRA